MYETLTVYSMVEGDARILAKIWSTMRGMIPLVLSSSMEGPYIVEVTRTGQINFSGASAVA